MSVLPRVFVYRTETYSLKYKLKSDYKAALLTSIERVLPISKMIIWPHVCLSPMRSKRQRRGPERLKGKVHHEPLSLYGLHRTDAWDRNGEMGT